MIQQDEPEPEGELVVILLPISLDLSLSLFGSRSRSIGYSRRHFAIASTHYTRIVARSGIFIRIVCTLPSPRKSPGLTPRRSQNPPT